MLASPSSPTPSRSALTVSQQLALLVLRKSELSEAVLEKLRQAGSAGLHRRDFYEVARLGLAIQKGSFHVLNGQGRYEADRIAREMSRQLGMHVVTYDFGGRGRAPKVVCSCGDFFAFRTKAIPGWLVKLTQDAAQHRRHVADRDAALAGPAPQLIAAE